MEADEWLVGPGSGLCSDGLAGGRRGPLGGRSPAPPSAYRRLHNLPTQLTTFIGREQEAAEIKRLLGATRLLTLTGAGAGGKTRLALQVAADLVERYSDGVWLAQLASLIEPALVPKAVASARYQSGKVHGFGGCMVDVVPRRRLIVAG